MKIPITSITIPPDRQRKDMGDIESLAASLARDGQINPILVKQDNGHEKYALVAGHRRLLAAQSLGWTSIDASTSVSTNEGEMLAAALTETQLRTLEYVENVKRQDLSWQEKCLACADLHLLKQKELGFPMRRKAGGWTQANMAELTGLSEGTVAYMLQIATELRLDPPSAIHECRNYFDAVQFILKKYAEKVAYGEIERRRLLAQQSAKPLEEGPTLEKMGDPIIEDGLPQDLSQSEDKLGGDYKYTVLLKPDDSPTEIQLCGHPTAFTCQPGAEGLAWCILLKDPSFPEYEQAMKLLGKNGYLIAWYVNFEHWLERWQMLHYFADDDDSPVCLPWPLIWVNSAASPITETQAPFFEDRYYGLVVSGSPFTTRTQPACSTLTAIDSGPDLPQAVVAYSVESVAASGCSVYCGPGVNPIDVASLGRRPFFFEPDPTLYAARVAALKAFYTETIPNCTFHEL